MIATEDVKTMKNMAFQHRKRARQTITIESLSTACVQAEFQRSSKKQIQNWVTSKFILHENQWANEAG